MTHATVFFMYSSKSGREPGRPKSQEGWANLRDYSVTSYGAGHRPTLGHRKQSQLVDGRQTLPYRITEGLPVTREEGAWK